MEMAEVENQAKTIPVSKKLLRERQQSARRVYLDPSSPSLRSVVRVVIITMVLLFIADSVKGIITSLAYLTFLLFLAIFFAYLIDPLVKLIRRPFKQRNREHLMPPSIAIPVGDIFEFVVVGIAIS